MRPLADQAAREQSRQMSIDRQPSGDDLAEIYREALAPVEPVSRRSAVALWALFALALWAILWGALEFIKGRL
jgi:hypothetical protein